jgi:hypothetical protein
VKEDKLVFYMYICICIPRQCIRRVSESLGNRAGIRYTNRKQKIFKLVFIEHEEHLLTVAKVPGVNPLTLTLSFLSLQTLK